MLLEAKEMESFLMHPTHKALSYQPCGNISAPKTLLKWGQ